MLNLNLSQVIREKLGTDYLCFTVTLGFLNSLPSNKGYPMAPHHVSHHDGVVMILLPHSPQGNQEGQHHLVTFLSIAYALLFYSIISTTSSHINNWCQVSTKQKPGVLGSADLLLN